MIRNENVSVSINGNVAYPDNINIVSSVNKAYNSVVVTGLSLIASVGDNISITVNSNTFSFVITEINFEEFGKITVRGFGEPYTLENKEVNISNTIYSDSDTLIDVNKGSINVINNIPNIIFDNVTYNTNGNALSAMIDMLSVIGGEYYETDGSLHLDKLKTIPENVTPFKVISESEVSKYSYTNKIGQSEQIKNVLINPITNDIYSIPSVDIDFDDDRNRGVVLFNPSINQSSVYKIQGIKTRPLETIYYSEEISLNEDTVLTTLGGVDAIVSLSIDDIEVPENEYEFYPSHNKLRFLSKKSGSCYIKYQTNILKFSISRDTAVSIKYLNAILNTNLKKFTREDDKNINNIEIPDDIILDNNMGTVRIVPPFMYGGEGVILSSGTVTYNIIFYNKNTDEEFDNFDFIKSYDLPLGSGMKANVYCKYKTGEFWDASFIYNATVKEVADIIIEEFKVSLSPDVNSQSEHIYTYTLSESGGLNEVLADGVTLEATDYVIVGDFFKLINTNYVGSIFKISYTVFRNKITFPLPTPDVNVTTVEARVDNSVTSLDFINPSNNLCVVPSTITVNIAERLNVSVATAYGSKVTGDFGDLIVDYFGNVKVYISNKRIYVIDTDSVIPYSSITIDARGVI